MANPREDEWPNPWLVLGLAIALALFAYFLYGCAGPYRGPDAIPDRVGWGYGWGDTDGSIAANDRWDADSEQERWNVWLEWDLMPPALPSESDARRNELLEEILTRGPETAAAADGSENVLRMIEDHPISFLMILALFPLGLVGWVVYKRHGGSDT